jgi:hypothetical protein
VLSEYLKTGVSLNTAHQNQNAVPGAAIAVQTFGEFLNFNPHLHIVATDRCFYGERDFMKSISPNAADLEAAFIVEVFKLLKKENKISQIVIINMSNWQHSGFNVYCGQAVSPEEDEAVERLAPYIVRAPISQERMIYISKEETADGIESIIYEGKTAE